MAVQGMQQLIEWIYGFAGDYGISIILVTAGIRILLIPLDLRQRKQMQKQQRISEEAEKLKEKYRNDRQTLEKELQKLYQYRGIGAGGCLVPLIQFPVMMCLYHAIRLTAAAGASTVLLPWVSSLFVRDPTFLLPLVTLFVQILPQTYPYIGYFRALKLQKMSLPMMFSLLLMNGMFAFVIPSGVGLYYLASGIFSAAEQLVICIFLAGREKKRIVMG